MQSGLLVKFNRLNKLVKTFFSIGSKSSVVADKSNSHVETLMAWIYIKQVTIKQLIFKIADHKYIIWLIGKVNQLMLNREIDQFNQP